MVRGIKSRKITKLKTLNLADNHDERDANNNGIVSTLAKKEMVHARLKHSSMVDKINNHNDRNYIKKLYSYTKQKERILPTMIKKLSFIN